MISYRPLSADDPFDDLIDLSRDFFAEYAAYHPDFFQIKELEDATVIDYFNFMRANGVVFVALDGARMVGYISAYVKTQSDYWQVRQVGEVSGLMVARNYRRQGIARQLLAEVEHYFRGQGLRYFTLYTAVENRGGLAFYKRSGMTPLQLILLGDLEAN